MEGKERALPLSDSQRLILLKKIRERHDEINNKSTAPGVIERKKKAWEEIASQFNAMYPDQHPRSTKQLKRSYDHVKRKVKVEDREYKKKIKTTGGGPPPIPPQPKEELVLAASMMQADLAMGNEVFETYLDTPEVVDTEGDTIVLEDEGDLAVAGPSVERPFTPSDYPPLSPDDVPSVSCIPSTIVPSCASPLSPAILETQNPPQTSTASTSAEASTSRQGKTAQQKKTRISAKDDAYFCRTRQQEYHRLKIAQMKEVHELEVEERKLAIQKYKKEIEHLEKLNTALDDVHGKITMVCDAAKRSYDSMAALD